ncbi:hypothetical protein GPX89_07770 [Nocardia sp. ET3-3]|uniref:Uncharacterized protein n=1 Tax=Nocardia terrae TaxID=2675851 RepID=A0A7K1US36_9NOCA|nr:hypothetical protein [Nocardia terrae]
MTPAIVHLHVEFGPLILDFQGGQQQVSDVAAELSTIGLALVVTVDDHVMPGMPKLPCSWLWGDGSRPTSAGRGLINDPYRSETSLTTRTGPIGAGPLCFRSSSAKGGL